MRGRLTQLILAFMIGLLFATVMALALVQKKGYGLMHQHLGYQSIPARECLMILAKGK